MRVDVSVKDFPGARRRMGYNDDKIERILEVRLPSGRICEHPAWPTEAALSTAVSPGSTELANGQRERRWSDASLSVSRQGSSSGRLWSISMSEYECSELEAKDNHFSRMHDEFCVILMVSNVGCRHRLTTDEFSNGPRFLLKSMTVQRAVANNAWWEWRQKQR